LADYREHYNNIRSAGATIAAASVDEPDKSQALREQLSLPFPILCDTERRVVQDWDIYNPREKGGIAKPAVFIIGRDRTVLFAAIETVSSRVAPSEVIRLLQTAPAAQTVRQKLYIPRLGEWLRAIRNVVRG
jgi:peroxiredoxin